MLESLTIPLQFSTLIPKGYSEVLTFGLDMSVWLKPRQLSTLRVILAEKGIRFYGFSLKSKMK